MFVTVSTTDKYRAEEPRYLWYCGTKKYGKDDGTGTVEKWYRSAAVVPWYHATLPYTISYTCSFTTDTLSPTDFDILKLKCIKVITVTFQGHTTSSITWLFDSPILLPTGPPLTQTSYLELYSATKSRLWPLRVTWRHQSWDHSIPQIWFPIGAR